MRTETHLKSNKQATTKRANASTAKHDVIVLLKQDHMAVKKMFSQYEKLAKQEDIQGKVKIANQICAELIAHTTAEEEVFYPAAREATHDDDMLNEANVEHDSARDLIGQIQSMDPKDEMYDAKVKVLGEYIAHHVEEEETEMFPMVRESKKLNLKEMGVTLSRRKQVLMKELCNSAGEVVPQQLRAKLGLAGRH